MGLFNYRETLYSKRKGTSSAQYRFSIGGDNVTSRTCCKKIWRQTVLEDVNLKVNQGDVVVILGPSGSGKTTFLRCLNHLEKADSGSLKLADKDYDLGKLTKKDILEIRQKTAFVFQHYNLFANKTALENILEGLVIARKNS